MYKIDSGDSVFVAEVGYDRVVCWDIGQPVFEKRIIYIFCCCLQWAMAEGELLRFCMKREFIIDVSFCLGNHFLSRVRCCMCYAVDVFETSVYVDSKTGSKCESPGRNT